MVMMCLVPMNILLFFLKEIEAITLDENATISSDYINNYTKRAEKEVAVSNDIIVHDLIKKIDESNKVINGG